MMKYKKIPLDPNIEQTYISNSFARYKSVIQEQFALAKNSVCFDYTDSISYKERQFLLEVLQELQDSINS